MEFITYAGIRNMTTIAQRMQGRNGSLLLYGSYPTREGWKVSSDKLKMYVVDPRATTNE